MSSTAFIRMFISACAITSLLTLAMRCVVITGVSPRLLPMVASVWKASSKRLAVWTLRYDGRDWGSQYSASSRNTRQGTKSLARSEEHTSELQSHSDLVCRLLLEKKKKNTAEQIHV